MPMMMGSSCRNAEERLTNPEAPFSAREYAKALNLLLQLYNVTQAHKLGPCVTPCTHDMCVTLRHVHTFIYHGEG